MSANPQADMDTMFRAQRTVLGVVKARQIDSQNDAALLINGYLEEETAKGRSIASSWALLFSASTVWLDALIRTDAAHHKTTPATRLSELAVSHAVESGK